MILSHLNIFYSGIVFSDPVDTAHNINAANNEVCKVYIKDEPIDEAGSSVSPVQHQMFKTENSIDVKNEPLATEDNSSIKTVSFSC